MLRSLLKYPIVYRTLQKCFNADYVHRYLLSYSGYVPGMRTLDIGCGPGDLAKHFDPRDYTGIDVSEEYIHCARQKRLGTFHVLPAERVGELSDSFDLALMVGVFHHLSDEAVRATLSGLERVLKSSGRFVLLEAVWPTHWWDLPGYVIRKMDRGNFVRSQAAWCRLLGEKWRLEQPAVRRNVSIEYFTCVLRPPTETHVALPPKSCPAITVSQS